ncbi:SGNH/GDSL hydrolase family protein [Neptunitalea lumnitzerae]|nr:GDSL-type esterase/lipase family protein [Neptunitalea sp. Y10]
MKYYISTLCYCMGILCVFAQNNPVWDDTKSKHWLDEFTEVSVPASIDSTQQKAMLYASTAAIPQPLIVSLHTWSGTYAQKDPLCKEILARNWNYIHPDFKGANNHPEAMGCPLVITAIEDAISYALAHTNANPKEVHIVGVSGGGYATLLAYMNIKYPVKSFSAWAPISDIEKWYWESVGRKQKYAADIEQALGGTFNAEAARERSPIWQQPLENLRANAILYIYEGVHDGYTGSVPITHSINMYNKLVADKKAPSEAVVTDEEIIELLATQYSVKVENYKPLFKRGVYLQKHYDNINLTIFEGGHEQLPQALALLPVETPYAYTGNVLLLGDSNAEKPEGWANQLIKLLPDAEVVNISKSGRTIGFDNLGRTELNALRNIDTYLNDAYVESNHKTYRAIVVCLGTNDAKKVFEGREEEVIANFDKLLTAIKKHKVYKKRKTQLIMVTPPPMRTYDMAEKYTGGNERLALLMPQLMRVATDKGFEVLDVFNSLQGVFDNYTEDGVHMQAEGQLMIANRIADLLRN